MRVFVIAASSLTRVGLEDVLKKRKVRVAGSAASLAAAEARLAESATDVLLLDANGDVEHVTTELSDSGITSELPVVILTAEARASDTAAALRAGARAVLPSETSPEQLVAALEAAVAGLLVLHPADVAAAMPATSGAPAAQMAELVEPLTARERQVLQMVAAGLANKEIAARLGISEHTVKFHVAAILGKLGAESRTEAVGLGIRRGLVLL